MSRHKSKKLLYVHGKKGTMAVDLSKKEWYQPLMLAIHGVAGKNGLITMEAR